MIRLHILARSFAATAVAGLALFAFSGVASATTLSVSVPGVLDGGGTSHPIVTVGTGSATNPPAPGTDASLPTHVEVNGHPSASSLPVPDPTGQGGQLAAMGSGHVKVDACIAATILSGDDPQSCPGAIDGSNPIVGQVSGLEDAGMLPRALADVGGCVELQQAASAPVAMCTSSIPTGALPTGSLPTGSLPTGSLPTGSLPTGSLPTGSLPAGSLPTGSLGGLSTLGAVPSAAALDPATMTKALSASGLCDLADQVGLSAVLSCSNSATAPSVPVGNAGNPLNPKALCLGFAAVVHVDTASCASAASATPAAHARATVAARHDGGATTNTGSAAHMSGSCVANVGTASSTAPFSPATAGGFAGLGFGLAAFGKALRHLRRPVTA